MSQSWEKLIRPMLFRLDAEKAHEFGIHALKAGLAAPYYSDNRNSHIGPVERFGLKFPNPIGVAAGFDKNGVVVDKLARLGFGFIEVGTVTLRPQTGNKKPRIFRLPKDRALINRLGFNNDGAAVIAERLSKLKYKCIVGVNIGKNKDVPIEEAVENYLSTFELIHPVADYIAVNVSSPNTPGLRELQRADELSELLGALQTRNRELTAKPLLIKIAPDLTEGEIEAIADICLRHEIDGIIATNTTVSRDGLTTADADALGSGGLSGQPLANHSNEVISTLHRHLKGKLTIIGVGGIFSAEDTFGKIASGASLIQAYTGFVYSGPRFAREIDRGVAKILRTKGFSRLNEAIGCDAGL